jgi:hypothetical protein|tara:strand:- start:4373 stop:4579 length:207 start_codon:yes stop_codon:yes gene_type:complete
MIGEMFFKDIDGDVWQYELKTNPREAIYWDTYKLKVSDIKVLGSADKETKNRVRLEIYKDIENVGSQS